MLAFALLSCSAEGPASAAEVHTEDIATKTAVEHIEQAVATAESTQGIGQPPMWILSDEDTKIYIFGTVHLLPGGLQWKTEDFQNAFNVADTLYLEVDSAELEAQQAIQALVQEHGLFTDGQTLSTVLNTEDYTAVEQASGKVGVPIAALWCEDKSTLQTLFKCPKPTTMRQAILIGYILGKAAGYKEYSTYGPQLLDELFEEDRNHYVAYGYYPVDIPKDYDENYEPFKVDSDYDKLDKT